MAHVTNSEKDEKQGRTKMEQRGRSGYNVAEGRVAIMSRLSFDRD